MVSKELHAQGFVGDTTSMPSAQPGCEGCRYPQGMDHATLQFAGVFSASRAAPQLWFTLADAALDCSWL